ncbi:MAG: DUF2304 domain-containing protein [Deltaproteobacteria bacterium]|nr:DUF2304 domain-containing protein [Deltaproteobacteria bacterium]MBW2372797.1 DUF2304 domain-containing protein [Deltaproteobacteria bacterium]
MNEQERLADLRSLMLAAPDSASVQLVALLFAGTLMGIVLWLVRRRTLRAEYTPIWMGVALAILIASLDLDMLRLVAQAIGAWSISSTLFFLGELFLLGICLNYAVRISQAGAKITELAQEVALLRRRLDEVDSPS